MTYCRTPIEPKDALPSAQCTDVMPRKPATCQLFPMSTLRKAIGSIDTRPHSYIEALSEAPKALACLLPYSEYL